MREKTISQDEIQVNFAQILSQMDTDQELVVLDGETPVARITSISASKAEENFEQPKAWEQFRVRFAEFEFPFP